jgi:hypothetical protein
VKWEFTRSHHADGWLVLRGRSVSCARGTPYLPIIELLKTYLGIQDRDDPREVRARVADSLLTLDPTLQDLLTPLLALFDTPIDDATWSAGSAHWKRSSSCSSGEVRPSRSSSSSSISSGWTPRARHCSMP